MQDIFDLEILAHTRNVQRVRLWLPLARCLAYALAAVYGSLLFCPREVSAPSALAHGGTGMAACPLRQGPAGFDT